jgi:hypothetical protein
VIADQAIKNHTGHSIINITSDNSYTGFPLTKTASIHVLSIKNPLLKAENVEK